ncbi:MAG: hypothetical protein ACRYFX_31835 [Janthinobacterium lividum]
MKKVFLSLGLAALLLGPLAPAARAWGVAGHRAVTQVAVYELPSGMQAFYFRHMPQLVRLSSSFNERPAAGNEDFGKHYLMIDHFAESNPFTKMPHDFDQASVKFTADTLRKYGTLPWAIIEVKNKLVAAFGARDTTAIIQASAELSSLTADAFAPLHTTVNYNGQYTNQPEIQALWETQLPDKYLPDYKLVGEEAKVLKNLPESVWLSLVASHRFLVPTFDLEAKVEKEGHFTPQTKYAFAHRQGRTVRRYSDAFVEAYEKAVGEQVAFRLQSAAPLIASLWLSAWQEAGHPDLAGLMPTPKLRNDEKQALETQLKAWKANTLAQSNLLLALQKDKKVVAADDIQAASGEAAPPPPPEAAPVAPAAPGTAPAKVKVKTKTPAAPPVKQKAKPKSSDGWD